jgi:hypothetical protein
MKKKTGPAPETVVPPQILEQAKRAVEPDRLPRPSRCVVCDSECSANTPDGLCWVCRRLKNSAWRDIDPQLSAQE